MKKQLDAVETFHNAFGQVNAYVPKLLSEKDLTSLMIKWHQETSHKLYSIDSFLNRINRGKNWNKFDQNDHPTKRRIRILKINKGSKNCVVSLCTFHKDYPHLLSGQIKSLKKTGFDGYHISFWGEFPNPTGKEIKYIGVPYCFKFFCIKYAAKMGFSNILWADSAMHFEKNPIDLFNFIENNGGYFQFYRNESNRFRKLFMTDISVKAANEIYGVDLLCDRLLNHRFIACGVFGLNMNHIKAGLFCDLYDKALQNGDVFCSGSADETVTSAILAMKPFKEFADNCDNYELNNNIIYAPQCEKMTSGKKGESILVWQNHRHP